MPTHVGQDSSQSPLGMFVSQPLEPWQHVNHPIEKALQGQGRGNVHIHDIGRERFQRQIKVRLIANIADDKPHTRDDPCHVKGKGIQQRHGPDLAGLGVLPFGKVVFVS